MPYIMTQKVMSGLGYGMNAIKTGDWEYSELVKGFCSGYGITLMPLSIIQDNIDNENRFSSENDVLNLINLSWNIHQTTNRIFKFLPKVGIPLNRKITTIFQAGEVVLVGLNIFGLLRAAPTSGNTNRDKGKYWKLTPHLLMITNLGLTVLELTRKPTKAFVSLATSAVTILLNLPKFKRKSSTSAKYLDVASLIMGVWSLKYTNGLWKQILTAGSLMKRAYSLT